MSAKGLLLVPKPWKSFSFLWNLSMEEGFSRLFLIMLYKKIFTNIEKAILFHGKKPLISSIFITLKGFFFN